MFPGLHYSNSYKFISFKTKNQIITSTQSLEISDSFIKKGIILLFDWCNFNKINWIFFANQRSRKLDFVLLLKFERFSSYNLYWCKFKQFNLRSWWECCWNIFCLQWWSMLPNLFTIRSKSPLLHCFFK